MPLESNFFCDTSHFYIIDFWKKVEEIVKAYIDTIPPIFNTERYFVCLSVIGCKGVVSYWNFRGDISTIDRDEVLCPPTVFANIANSDETERNLKLLKLNSKLALSIVMDDVIQLLDELYPEQ